MTTCFLCGSREFTTRFSDSSLNGFRLIECNSCSMVIATSDQKTGCDYDDYGDYLVNPPRHNAAKIVEMIHRKNRRTFSTLKRRYGPHPRLLDFGSGAGYFVKAALGNEFDAFGMEISQRLRTFSITLCGQDRIHASLETAHGTFDAITMFEVIEHLPPEQIKEIVGSLVHRLKPGGILYGTTPNFRSVNVLAHGTKDPVISPPAHVCYFTPKTLDRFLREAGLIREFSFTGGLSTNSFFRPRKDEYSFLELPLKAQPFWRRPVVLGVKIVFRAAGLLLRLTPFGYSIYFRYRKP